MRMQYLYGIPDANFSTINTTKAKSSGIAFFGQATFTIAKKLDITGGLRYDYEHKEQSVRVNTNMIRTPIRFLKQDRILPPLFLSMRFHLRQRLLITSPMPIRYLHHTAADFVLAA